jgi:hypothetical protein
MKEQTKPPHRLLHSVDYSHPSAELSDKGPSQIPVAGKIVQRRPNLASRMLLELTLLVRG